MTVTFRFNAAACVLAQAIYYARAQAFTVEAPTWGTLDYTTRALYVDQAQRMLVANRPAVHSSALLDSFAGLSRQYAAKVLPMPEVTK